MEIEFTSCKVDGDVVELAGKFAARMTELERIVGKSHYDSDSIANRVFTAIANKVAEEYLKIHKMELVNSIDLKQITDAIQLKVVEGFSLKH